MTNICVSYEGTCSKMLSSKKEKKLTLHLGYFNHFPQILTSKLFYKVLNLKKMFI